MSVDMILIDSQSTVVPATINANRLTPFLPLLKAGSTYCVRGFDVTRCNPNFRLTDSNLLIRFNDTTALHPIPQTGSLIPLEYFRFRNHDELHSMANTSTHLPDVIGELNAVKSTVGEYAGDQNHDIGSVNPPAGQNRVMVTMKLESGETVTLSLFDANAVSFHNKLEHFGKDPRVLVATSINPKIVGGRLFLNGTSGTHVFFDKDCSAGEQLFDRIVLAETGIRPASALLRGVAKVEPLLIAELQSFILTADPQDIEFLCTGVVTSVDTSKGWSYVGCSSCTKKLQRTASSYACSACNNDNAVGSLRYRVEMTISDDSGEGVFVGFDGVVTKLHHIRASEAAQLLAVDGGQVEDSQLPPFIADMIGRSYKFKVRVTAYNFTSRHQTFTISRIIGEHDPLPVPAFVPDAVVADHEDPGVGGMPPLEDDFVVDIEGGAGAEDAVSSGEETLSESEENASSSGEEYEPGSSPSPLKKARVD